jgi:hypothetical protein
MENSFDVYASLKMPSPIQEWGTNGFQIKYLPNNYMHN